jgi:hypothetical protein
LPGKSTAREGSAFELVFTSVKRGIMPTIGLRAERTSGGDGNLTFSTNNDAIPGQVDFTVTITRDGETERYTGTYTPEIGLPPGSQAR